MTTPAQYRHQLDEISSGQIPTENLTPVQVKENLAKLAGLVSQAQELERALNLDLQVLRTQYRSRAAAASSGLSSRVRVSNRNRPGSKDRAEEVEHITAERDARLAPYEEVKQDLEKFLASLDVLRQNLEGQQEKSGKSQARKIT